MKKVIMLLLLLLLVSVSGCEKEEKVDIYVTVYPVEWIVKEIVKDDYKVKSIYLRGQEVHEYNPTPKDLIQMSECTVLFYVGLGLEAFVEGAKDSTFKNTNARIVELGKYLNTEDTKPIEATSTHHHHDEDSETDHENESTYTLDPHIWMDPIRMIELTKAILANLRELFPDMNTTFTTRANETIKKLNDLHSAYETYLSSDEISSKTIMVDHDAYVYWTNRYGIERIKLRNSNESGEAIPSDFDEKVEYAKSLNIKYVLSTANEAKCSFFDRYLDALDATASSLHHLATITIEEENNNETYISLMMKNLDVLKTVLPKK